MWPPAPWRVWQERLRVALVSPRAPQAPLHGILVVAAVPLALGVYATYLSLKFGDPWLFLHVQSAYWHREWQPLWSSLLGLLQGYAAEPAWSASYTDILATARRVPVAYTLYMLALLACAVSLPTLGIPDMYRSAGRYLIAAIPSFLLLTRWGRTRPWLDMLLVCGGFLLQGFLTTYFLANHWLV